jgi:hypothetical protein
MPISDWDCHSDEAKATRNLLFSLALCKSPPRSHQKDMTLFRIVTFVP